MSQNHKIKILLYRYGTLSHSLIRNFNKSELLENIYIIAPNDFPKKETIWIGSGKTIKIGEHKKFIEENRIDFAIINSENYLSGGIIDLYKKVIKLPAVGATKEWFMLEASKKYCKEFMLKNGIKTPHFKVIYDLNTLKDCIEKYGLPLVIKNNNLQAGFGTYICHTKKDCIKRSKELLKLTKQNQKPFFIAEQFIEGSEISQHYAWDGNSLIPFKPVKDFKAFSNSKNIINTGGMGSYAPAFMTDKQKNMLNNYNNKLEDIFQTIKPDFKGIFVVNLLFTDNEIYTLEFNMRPGITEFETLIELFDFDLLKFYYDLALGQVNKNMIKYKDRLKAGCITVVDKDFAKRKAKNLFIPVEKLNPQIDSDSKIIINKHYDCIDKKNRVVLNKLNKFYTVVNTDKFNPFLEIYDYLKKVELKNIYYRKDIGDIYEK